MVNVDFPLPVRPRSPTRSLALRLNVTLWRAAGSSGHSGRKDPLRRVGPLRSNSMAHMRVVCLILLLKGVPGIREQWTRREIFLGTYVITRIEEKNVAKELLTAFNVPASELSIVSMS